MKNTNLNPENWIYGKQFKPCVHLQSIIWHMPRRTSSFGVQQEQVTSKKIDQLILFSDLLVISTWKPLNLLSSLACIWQPLHTLADLLPATLISSVDSTTGCLANCWFCLFFKSIDRYPENYYIWHNLYLKKIAPKAHYSFLVKAVVFPVVEYGCESWTIKRAECWRIDAVELWCWRRLLKVPCTVRRSGQSVLKEISLEYSLEGLMLKLKLQYFGHLMQRTDSLEESQSFCWERLKAEGEGDGRGGDGWMASPTWWTWVWAISGSWWWIGRPGVLQSMGSQRVGHHWVTELNWLIS